MDEDLVIPLLGNVGVRVVQGAGDDVDFPEIVARWASAIQLESLELPATAGVDWLHLPVSELLEVDVGVGEEDPAFDFARQLARYVAALPSHDIAAQAVELIDVGSGHTNLDVRGLVTGQALRVVNASADLLTEQVEAGTVTPIRELMERIGAVAVSDRRLVHHVGNLVVSLQDQDLDRRLLVAAADPAIRPEASELHEAWRRLASFTSSSDIDPWPDVADIADALSRQAEPEREGDPDGTFVNIGFDDADRPGVRRSDQPLQAEEQVWMWIGIGPADPDALPTGEGSVEPLDPDHLHASGELEVVVFPDDSLTLSASSTLGWFRVVETGPFPVVGRADAFQGLDTDPAFTYRLYTRLTMPAERGTWRVRVAVFSKGVLLQVLQVTVPGGTSTIPTHRTTYRLISRLRPTDDLSSLQTPTITIYANASDETHDFAFYLPNGAEPSLSKLVHLEPASVQTLTDQARRWFRQVSWGQETDLDWDGLGGDPPKTVTFWLRDAMFGTAEQVAEALVSLAIVGRHLWQAFADRIEAGPEFRDAMRKLMKDPGVVQLAIKDSPDLIVPLQVLYDRRLDTALPNFIHLCSATEAWLDAPEGDPPCLTFACPNADDDHRVCVAGFWGIRHAITISPPHRRDWAPVVPSLNPPSATVARARDPRIDPYWTDHMRKLATILQVPRPNPAGTSTEVFDSLKEDASVLAYFLAHVEYHAGAPRIVLNKEIARGALNVTSLDGIDLSEHRPLIFVNACASAGLSPDRLLGLVNGFVEAGASGAVGTEITVFVDTAVRFAEEMLTSYAAGTTLGESMRRGRIELLRQHNPLGFVYVSFGLHDLRLVAVEVNQLAVPAAAS
jgi:hypothetical protein